MASLVRRRAEKNAMWNEAQAALTCASLCWFSGSLTASGGRHQCCLLQNPDEVCICCALLPLSYLSLMHHVWLWWPSFHARIPVI